MLAPLGPIRIAFYKNPHLVEDLTRINQQVPAEHTLPPTAWEKMPPEEAATRLAEGRGWIFNECFVYAPHDLLGDYPLSTRDGPRRIGHYLVDFATTFRAECQAVERGRPAPTGSKILELTIATRKQLREKLATYYSRVPDEDMVEIAG